MPTLEPKTLQGIALALRVMHRPRGFEHRQAPNTPPLKQVAAKTLDAALSARKVWQMPIFDNHAIRYTPDKNLNAS